MALHRSTPLLPAILLLGFSGLAVAAPLGTINPEGTAIRYPALNIAEAIAESDRTAPQSGPYIIAQNYNEQSFSPADAGVWRALADGRVTWQLRITVPQALHMNLGTFFNLPPSAFLTLLDGDGNQHFRSFSADDNSESGELWSPLVPGDTIELFAEMDAKDADHFKKEFVVFSVNPGIRPLSFNAADALQVERSGSCNVDVECPQGDAWEVHSRAVVFITIGGGGVCSGTLMNNTAEDFAAYILTADHCGISTANDQSTVAYFNFQNSTCRTPGSGASGGNGDGPLNQFLSGGVVLGSRGPTGDTTLMEMNNNPQCEWNPVWAGWNRSSSNFSGGAAIHHPSGDEKRISTMDGVTSTGNVNIGGIGVVSCFVTDWSSGVTEPGSSGSPLFGPIGVRVHAVLSGGSSSCANPGGTDAFTRLGSNWTTSSFGLPLRDILDPLGTNASTLNHIEFQAPPQAVTVFPADGATDIETGPNLDWDPVMGASNYQISVYPVGNPGSPVVDAVTTVFTSLNLPDGLLDEGTEYSWTVSPNNCVGLTQGNPVSFTTVGGTPCPGDVDGNNAVDLADLNALLAAFGQNSGGDVDGDGDTDLADLNLVLANFGTAC